MCWYLCYTIGLGEAVTMLMLKLQLWMSRLNPKNGLSVSQTVDCDRKQTGEGQKL